jgi:type VI secretion system secreted protein Hcp
MAQVDYFLKLDGIEGESTDHKHKNEIQLLSWSWGESNAGSHHWGSGGGTGKVQMQDFHFVMHTNKASPKLMLACASGEHIKKGKLTTRKAGKEQQEYLVIDMTDVFVSSYQTGGSDGQLLPTEQISLNFAKIEFDYKEQKDDGSLGASVKAGWNMKENKKV